MNSLFLDEYFFSICFVDFQLINYRAEWITRQLRDTLVKNYNIKDKSGLKTIFREFKNMKKDMNESEKQALTNYLLLFDNAKKSFKSDKIVVKAPENLEQYFHFILKTGELYEESTNDIFQDLNAVVLQTDVKVLSKHN